MFQWTHSDPRGLAAASAQAVARCQSMGWGLDSIGASSGTRAEDLLALIAESFLLRQEFIDAGNASLLSQLAPVGNRVAINVGVGTAPDVDHVNAQVILLRTWEVLGRAEGWNEQTAAQLSATTGRPVSSSTQSNVVAIVAIVVGIVMLAGLIAFVVWNVNTIVDRELARRAQAQELMRAHADCQTMLQTHSAAERQAGHAIPFTTPELMVMARLAALQDGAMQGFKATLEPPILPVRPQDPVGALENVLTLAVVLGFLYLLIDKRI